MATYSAQQLGIKPPSGGFQEGGWYQGRQYVGGTFSDPGVIHQSSNQQGAGQAVSKEVNAQSAAAQGTTSSAFEAYLEQQRKSQPANALPGESSSFSGNGLPGGDGSGVPGSVTTPDILNLPNLYESLYASSGIKDIEDKLTKDTLRYNEVKAGINDNPYLAEATRSGRIAKLDEKFNADAMAIKNDIATKKADIEMKLNLETKQFDIESQAAQTALDRFNTLLSAGALDNASGDDIANITRSTGLSSSAIYSAVNAQKMKNMDTQVISYDDGTNQGFAVIDSKTGNVISTQKIASSKPKSGSSELKKTDYVSKLKSDAKSGATLSQIFAIYAGFLEPDEIYNLYNSSSKYGPDKGSVSSLSKYGVTQPKSTGRSG